MRHREEYIYSTTETVVRSSYSACTGSPATSSTEGLSYMFRYVNDCPDESIPKGKENRMRRRWASYQRYFEVSTREVIRVPCNNTIRRTALPTNCSRDTGPFFYEALFYPEPPIPPVSQNEFVYLVNAAAARAQSECLDLLTFLAEYGKTMTTVARLMNLAFDQIEDITKRALTGRVADVPKRLSALWLEGRYGVRPIMYDIKGLVQQLQRGMETQAIGTARVVHAPTEASLGYDSDRGTSIAQITQSSKIDVTTRGWAIAYGVFGNGPQFNIPLTLYELTTLSFVLDWFWDIGSYLASVIPSPNVNVGGCSYSTRVGYEVRNEILYKTKPGSGWIVEDSTPGSSHVRTDFYVRIPSTVNIPAFYPRLSTVKVIDLVALLLQRTGSIRSLLRGI